MRTAVEMRAKGWSQRAIAAYLEVDQKTICRDLRRWDMEQNVRHFPVPNASPSEANASSKCLNDNVIQLRRDRHEGAA
jgi:hypothetical protein